MARKGLNPLVLDGKTWAPGVWVAREIGLPQHYLVRAARNGQVRELRIPPGVPLYSVEDILTLVNPPPLAQHSNQVGRPRIIEHDGPTPEGAPEELQEAPGEPDEEEVEAAEAVAEESAGGV